MISSVLGIISGLIDGVRAIMRIVQERELREQGVVLAVKKDLERREIIRAQVRKRQNELYHMSDDDIFNLMYPQNDNNPN